MRVLCTLSTPWGAGSGVVLQSEHSCKMPGVKREEIAVRRGGKETDNVSRKKLRHRTDKPTCLNI